MAGVSVDGGGRSGGRRSIVADINMVPMIDLLLCCIMFLLVTAVWTQLARIPVSQSATGIAPVDVEPASPSIALVLSVRASGFVLGDTAGARREIPRSAGAYDFASLGRELRARRRMEPNRRALVVAPEDGVRYAEVVAAMDVGVGEGFSELSLSSEM